MRIKWNETADIRISCGMILMLLRWQIDWQILKAQEWSAGSGARFSVRESRDSRGLQT
jgi:hypothetical protein